MSDLSQSQMASLVLNPGDVYRISTGGTATVRVIYGAPAGTTTITASFATFGPYDAPAKLDVTAVSGTASYSLLAAIPVTKVDGKFSDPALQALVSGAWNPLTADVIELLPAWDLSKWTDLAAPAGCTWTQDNTVLFGGRPTIRLDIPANTAGGCRAGTLVEALGSLPAGWDASGFKCAIKSSNLSCVNGVDPRIALDTAFAGWYAWAGEGSVASVPEPYYQAGDWMIFNPLTPTAQGTAPAWPGSLSGQRRLRFSMTASSVPTATQVWIGFFGIAKKRKPKLVMSFDDGFDSWRTFVVPMLKYYGIPATFHMAKGSAGGAGFMTESQIVDLHNDPSGLFEVANHGVDNNGYATDGAALYLAKMIECREWLRGLGIRGDSIHHHAWVQGQRGADIIAMAQAAGFLSCRTTVVSNQRGIDDQLAYTGQEKWMYSVMSCSQPGSGVTLANLQSHVQEACVTNKYGVTHINWHDFGPTDTGAPRWSYDKFADACAWLRAQADAGVFEFMTYGRSTAAATGRAYVK